MNFEQSALNIDPSRMPQHVAIVMDGNGRWAQKRGLSRTQGHAKGEDALFDTVEGALQIGLKWLTVYAFSTENWRRPVEEVKFLMSFNEGILVRHRDDLNNKGVRIRFAGRRDFRVPKRLIKHMDQSMELTKKNTRLTLTICFNYGGRAEIIDAVKEIVRAKLPPEKINQKTFAKFLYWPDMPDPDLVIRTSGEYRISNYLIYQIAYSELVFTPVLWPDFRRKDLFEAICEYQKRDRRFGALTKA
jgi:undecaprenyl diphosphate synthase